MSTLPLSVTFWGTRGSIATPGAATEKYGGNTACVSVDYGDTHVILDAGTGIRKLGLALAEACRSESAHLPIYHLLLSHTHWDHIQGLPFFAPAYMHGVKLAIYGVAKRERFLHQILSGQMDETYFPVQMKALAAEVKIHEIGTTAITLGAVSIAVQQQQQHPGGTVRFRIEAGGKCVVYATDVELDMIVGPCADCPDAQAEATYREFIRDADLLIGDGQYSQVEYSEKKGWGHTSIPLLIHIAGECNVKRLAIFHHDPEHTDAMLDHFQDALTAGPGMASQTSEIFWAREGMCIQL